MFKKFSCIKFNFKAHPSPTGFQDKVYITASFILTCNLPDPSNFFSFLIKVISYQYPFSKKGSNFLVVYFSIEAPLLKIKW